MNYKLAFALGSIAPGAWGSEGKEPDEQWITMYDGVVVTSAGNYYGAGSEDYTWELGTLLVVGESYTFRITVDGVTEVHQPTKYLSAGCGVGNSWLNASTTNTTAVDNGGNHYVFFSALFGIATRYFKVFTRSPGEHSVKIERLVTSENATE